MLEVVAAAGGGAEQRDGAAGHQDVAVARRTQAIDHVVADALVMDQDRALGITQLDVAAAGQAGDVHRPGPAGIDVLAGADRGPRAAAWVAAKRGPNFAAGDAR